VKLGGTASPARPGRSPSIRPVRSARSRGLHGAADARAAVESVSDWASFFDPLAVSALSSMPRLRSTSSATPSCACGSQRKRPARRLQISTRSARAAARSVSAHHSRTSGCARIGLREDAAFAASTSIFSKLWTTATFEVLQAGPTDTWKRSSPSRARAEPGGQHQFGTLAASTRWAPGRPRDLTFNLADRLPKEFLPIVSGYTGDVRRALAVDRDQHAGAERRARGGTT